MLEQKFSEDENIRNLIDENYINIGNDLISKELALTMLKPGHAIKAYIRSSKTWDINVVLNISEQNILIPFKEKYIAETLMINDMIKCSFNIENYSINLLCVVKNIFLTSLPTVLLKVLKHEVKRNTRATQRYEVKYLGKIRFDALEDKICYISDISLTGASIITKEQMIKGNSLKLTIVDNEFPMTVCWTSNKRYDYHHEDKIIYGLKFDKLTSQDEEKISSIIKQIEISEYESIAYMCKEYGIL